jgi:hypothetical protein
MFELPSAVIRPVTKPTSSSSNFEIEHKQELYVDEKRSRRLTLDILLSLPLFSFLAVCSFFHDLAAPTS